MLCAVSFLIAASLPALATPPAGRPLPAKAPAARQVRVPVMIEPPGEVTAADFNARVDGKDVKVTRVLSPQDDLLLLTVLDLSGEMSTVDTAREALAAGVSGLPRNIYVAVLRASDGARVVLDPSNDRRAAIDAIRAVPLASKAAMLETVETTAQIAAAIAAKSRVRVALLYITDSSIYNYREDFTNPVINSSDHRDLSRRFPEGLVRERLSRIEQSLASRPVPLFFVHLRSLNDRLNEAYQSGLLQLASATGGSGVVCRSKSEIKESILAMLGTVRSQYCLWVQLPDKPPRDFNLLIESDGRVLSYRSRYVLR
ncbi:MAG: hypothetical protein HYZ57_09600 [Acidobacteria bacterium]|nr:hypothetical protein [Acidobacteriota bacterium]